MHHVWIGVDVKQFIFDHMAEELKQKLGDLNYENSECAIVGIDRDSWYGADDGFVNFHCILGRNESSANVE